jgi:hypothetical protein
LHERVHVPSRTYEREDAPGDVVAEGELPVTFALIRQNLTVKSRRDDAGDLLLDPLFEIPIETVNAHATSVRWLKRRAGDAY